MKYQWHYYCLPTPFSLGGVSSLGHCLTRSEKTSRISDDPVGLLFKLQHSTRLCPNFQFSKFMSKDFTLIISSTISRGKTRPCFHLWPASGFGCVTEVCRFGPGKPVLYLELTEYNIWTRHGSVVFLVISSETPHHAYSCSDKHTDIGSRKIMLIASVCDLTISCSLIHMHGCTCG